MHRQNPLDLYHFANALMTVRAVDRPSLARALIGQAIAAAAKRAIRHPGLPAYWTQEFQSVCLSQKLDTEAANPGTFYVAGIGDRDGIQAYEVALAALTDMVRDAEAQAVEVAA